MCRRTRKPIEPAPARRRRLAEAVAAYMRGEIDNFAFDEAVWAAADGDRAMFPLAFTLWHLYDDVRRHPVRTNRLGWQFLRRCVALLLSDQPLPRRFDRRVDRPTLWPFASWSAVRAAAPALAAVPLPRFDPAVHARPIRPRIVTLAARWLWVAVGLLVAAAVIGFGRW